MSSFNAEVVHNDFRILLVYVAERHGKTGFISPGLTGIFLCNDLVRKEFYGFF